MSWWRKAAPEPPEIEDTREEAETARLSAEEELERIRAQRDEVKSASERLRRIREKNGFAAMIDRVLAERTE